MKKQYLLAIDNGTQSIRTILFDQEGNLIHKVQIHIEPYFSKNPGWAEQEPDYYWDTICCACKQLWEESKILPEQVAGMSVTTQRTTVINLDREGKPLRPAIVWVDNRKTEGLKPVGGAWGLMFKLIGESNSVRYIQNETEANWIKKHQPEIWEKTDKYLFLSGYLNYKFTGKFVDSLSSQVGYVPFDYKRFKWCKPNDWKWKAMAVKREMLPELFQPGASLGNVTAEAAAATGIPEGLPVIASSSDKACEIVGSGGLAPHVGCLSYGTIATINTTLDRYVEAVPLIPPFPAGVPGAYSLELAVVKGFWMISWFKKEFAQREQLIAKERGIQPEELFDELLNKVPAGSMGLTLQPFWSPGIKIPGPEAKGAIIGFSDVHTRAHVYRAILEGLAYALREHKERIEKRSKTKITELRVSGGGSQSDAAVQLTADVFGLPTSRPHIYETSSLGAAISASVGLGIHKDFATAIGKMTRVADTFQPIPENQKLYDKLYSEVYLKMYEKMKPLYQKIQDITGYPEKIL